MSIISRREVMKGMGSAVSLLALSGGRPFFAAAAGGSGGALALAPGAKLFIDDHLIAAQQNLRRVIEPPKRLPEPIVDAEHDKCFQPYVSVLRDPETNRFRMWYNASTTPPESTRSRIGYIESEDGVNWIRPHRELPDPSGIPVGFGAYVVDDGADFPDRSKRYKLAWEKNALFTAFSADGLTWAGGGERDLRDFGDIISLSRDPIRNRYLLLCKVHSTPEDGYKGSTPNAREGHRRLVGQSVSDDCIHWSPPPPHHRRRRQGRRRHGVLQHWTGDRARRAADRTAESSARRPAPRTGRRKERHRLHVPGVDARRRELAARSRAVHGAQSRPRQVGPGDDLGRLSAAG